MTGLIDTHCHIHSASAEKARGDNTLKKWHDAGETSGQKLAEGAANAGVTKLICVGTDLEDSIDALRFADTVDGCFASIGVHPHESQQYFKSNKDLVPFKELLTEKVVAIGEVGLDYYYDHSPREDQIRLLEMFLQFASDNNLPLIFHIRQAFKDFWPIYDNFKNIKGVLHSYTDNNRNLEEALQRELYIGQNGIITFSKNPDQLALAKEIPLSKLLLETDAPYLTPIPFRGKVCKPEYVKLVYEFMCDLRDENIEIMSEQISKNTHSLFKI